MKNFYLLALVILTAPLSGFAAPPTAEECKKFGATGERVGNTLEHVGIHLMMAAVHGEANSPYRAQQFSEEAKALRQKISRETLDQLAAARGSLNPQLLAKLGKELGVAFDRNMFATTLDNEKTKLNLMIVQDEKGKTQLRLFADGYNYHKSTRFVTDVLDSRAHVDIYDWKEDKFLTAAEAKAQLKGSLEKFEARLNQEYQGRHAKITEMYDQCANIIGTKEFPAKSNLALLDRLKKSAANVCSIYERNKEAIDKANAYVDYANGQNQPSGFVKFVFGFTPPEGDFPSAAYAYRNLPLKQTTAVKKAEETNERIMANMRLAPQKISARTRALIAQWEPVFQEARKKLDEETAEDQTSGEDSFTVRAKKIEEHNRAILAHNEKIVESLKADLGSLANGLEFGFRYLGELEVVAHSNQGDDSISTNLLKGQGAEKEIEFIHEGRVFPWSYIQEKLRLREQRRQIRDDFADFAYCEVPKAATPVEAAVSPENQQVAVPGATATSAK